MKKTVIVAMGALVASVAMGSTANAAKPASGLDVVLREYTSNFMLEPGETANVTSICLPGETVLGGSPTGIPGNVTLTLSFLVYDGTNSGWSVEYRNDGAETAYFSASTSALCTAGTLTPG